MYLPYSRAIHLAAFQSNPGYISHTKDKSLNSKLILYNRWENGFVSRNQSQMREMVLLTTNKLQMREKNGFIKSIVSRNLTKVKSVISKYVFLEVVVAENNKTCTARIL
jgi:hypothetical protein